MNQELHDALRGLLEVTNAWFKDSFPNHTHVNHQMSQATADLFRARSPEVAALIEAAVASDKFTMSVELKKAIEPFLPPPQPSRLEVECPVCGEPTRVECASCTWSRARRGGGGGVMALPSWEERCGELEEIKRAHRRRIAALEAKVERLRGEMLDVGGALQGARDTGGSVSYYVLGAWGDRLVKAAEAGENKHTEGDASSGQQD